MHVTVSSARNKDTCLNFCFDEVDKDKNGSVTLEELKLKMQPAVSKHEIKHFVQVYFFKSQLSLLQDLLKTYMRRGYLVTFSFPSCTDSILPWVFRDILLRRNSHI